MQSSRILALGNIDESWIADQFNKALIKCFNLMYLSPSQYHMLIKIMFAVGIFVFIALFFFQAGYGKFQKSSKIWSVFLLPNKIAWIIMEAPVFFVMLIFYFNSMMGYKENEKRNDIGRIICLVLFEIHYFQRSFIFPFLMKGKSQMPILIMMMGMIFNTCNGILQGNWLFNISNVKYYENIFKSISFYIGLLIFVIGMIINIHSDHVIRTLRKPGDTKHYLPQRGLYRYVTSANYFGEIIEWIGYAILTRSVSGVLFVFWSIANLLPRSFSIYNLYLSEFGSEVLNKKRIIPFLL